MCLKRKLWTKQNRYDQLNVFLYVWKMASHVYRATLHPTAGWMNQVAAHEPLIELRNVCWSERGDEEKGGEKRKMHVYTTWPSCPDCGGVTVGSMTPVVHAKRGDCNKDAIGIVENLDHPGTFFLFLSSKYFYLFKGRRPSPLSRKWGVLGYCIDPSNYFWCM